MRRLQQPQGAPQRIDDGEFFYQYDGLNRLIQVNEAGSLMFDEYGRVNGGAIGDLILRYTYDGLGRLIRKETLDTRLRQRELGGQVESKR